MTLPGLLAAGCVVGAGSRPTRLEAARAPGTARDDGVTGVGQRQHCGDEPPRPPKPSDTAVWVDGNCHFDGVDFVWIPGRWDTARGERVR